MISFTESIHKCLYLKGINDMSLDRKHNEERFQEFKKEGNVLDNAILCEAIADDNLLWNPSEALYWRKQGIAIREQICGKHNIDNTPYYDKIVEVLLEKGSYKEAIKWNTKSMKIKMKEKGEGGAEVLINKLLLAEALSLLYNDDESKAEADQAYNILENNISTYDQEMAYKAYLKLVHIYSCYNIGAQSHNLKLTLQNEVCGDKAIQIAKAFYGEQSIETAEAIRRKAITLGYDKQAAIALFAEAIKIFMNFDENKKYARTIFHNVRQKWEGDNVLVESAKWLYDNSSEKFVLTAIEDFAGSEKIKIKQALGLS